MRKEITNDGNGIFIDGYGSGETDFLTRLSQSSQEVKDDFERKIIQPILAVLASTDQTAVLSILGASDRVDTQGTSREQRRLQELRASYDRAKSAEDAVFQIVSSRVQGPFPNNFADVMQVGIQASGLGAAQLVEFSDWLSEEQRKRNRRVFLALFHFLP
jgi:hypothetical protein